MNTEERLFAQTVTEHKSTIYTVCYMFSNDTDEVNDLFQEVLDELSEKEGLKDISNLYNSEKYQQVIDKVRSKTKELAARKIKNLKKLL